MKLIELQTEKLKLESMLREGSYLEFVENDESGNAKKDTEFKQRYADDPRLLKKLDNINNALNEAYATTYIDLQGDRLSVATAKEYLEEVTPKKNIFTDSAFAGEDIMNKKQFAFEQWNNLHMCIMTKCSTVKGNRILFSDVRQILYDPLKLADRKAEFETKQRNWCFELMEAITIAEVTTDVMFNY